MIEVTNTKDGSTIWINPDYIVSVHDSEGMTIVVGDYSRSYWGVQEAAATVICMIAAARERRRGAQ